jgi:hypothetical protein
MRPTNLKNKAVKARVGLLRQRNKSFHLSTLLYIIVFERQHKVTVYLNKYATNCKKKTALTDSLLEQ